MGFDQLNAPNITKYTKAMLERLLKSNHKAYLKIAKGAANEAVEDIKALGLPAKPIVTDDEYVEGILEEYNPVTGYLYYPEADRKRARLAEVLIAAVLFGLRAEYHKQLRKFAKLWHLQTLQYGETMVDKTRIETFRKNGIKRVKWETKEDEKVCEECKERDGKIYPIDAIPTKPHYRCRCWVVPIAEKKDSNGQNR
jgi:SPP1 gp7 family putative phage head morphogenesis protein